MHLIEIELLIYYRPYKCPGPRPASSTLLPHRAASALFSLCALWFYHRASLQPFKTRRVKQQHSDLTVLLSAFWHLALGTEWFKLP